MKKRKWNPNITAEELGWLFEKGYVIRSTWISPYEGFEYRLSEVGKESVLRFAASARACFNCAKRMIEKTEK